MTALPEICAQCGRLAYPGSTVTIPADEYQELLSFRKAREATYERLPSFRLASRSRIGRDPELAQFILRCAETMIVRDVEAACIAKFGRARVPSKWSIHRFIHAVGGSAGK